MLWSEAVNPDRTRSWDQWLDGLARVVRGLEEDWGTWEVPWGEINRIQRPDASGQAPFDDALPSLPVAGALIIFISLLYILKIPKDEKYIDRIIGTKDEG